MNRGYKGFPESWSEFLGAEGPLFVSINRFERKKGLSLAVRALAELKAADDLAGGHPSVAGAARLVMAGGYDPRLSENVEHLAELQQEVYDLDLQVRPRRLRPQPLAATPLHNLLPTGVFCLCHFHEHTASLIQLLSFALLALQDSVRFLPSFSDDQRAVLLSHASAVLYTPENEHFGIVPLEAMAARCPVIACNSGGPRESIGQQSDPDQPGGILCEPTPSAFAAAMLLIVTDTTSAAQMAQSARARVVAGFSRRAFGDRLISEVEAVSGDCNLQMSPVQS